MGNDIRYMPEKLEQASNFANKIWNAAKFIINNNCEVSELKEFEGKAINKETGKFVSEYFKLEDKWIIQKLDELIATVTKNIEDYDLGIALDNIYSFIWNEFCDWYIEMSKIRLYGDNKEEKVQVCFVLNYLFATSLKLLHPFMPFITSELYTKVMEYDKDKDIIVTEWPENISRIDYNKEKDAIEKFKDLINKIRNIRNEKHIHPTKKANLIFVTTKYKEDLEEEQDMLLKLGFGSEMLIKTNREGIPENSISILQDDLELYMPAEGLIDMEEEKNRLESEIKRLESEVARGEKMLSNPGFINKAPQAKIEQEKEKLANYKKMLEDTKTRLAQI